MVKGTPSFGNTIDVRVYSNSISLTKSLREILNLNENLVLKYKFLQNGSISINKVAKITRNKNEKSSYYLKIQKAALEKENIKQPTTTKIEIIDKKQLGYRPIKNNSDNKLFDIVNSLDNKFTCFEEQNNLLNIYFLNKKATSIATMPRFIKIDGFSIWNIGFLLSDGFCNNHRISISNNEYYLIKLFLDYLKEYWKVNDTEIYVDIKIKPENYSEYVKGYWSSKLKINEDRIKVRKVFNKPTNAKYGNANITVYNTALALIHSNFVSYVLELIKPKEDVLSLIRGIEAGDGYAIEHNGVIEIGISSNIKDTNLICKLFEKLGYPQPKVERYHTSENADKIIYKGLNNAIRFLLDNHFEEHKERRENLIRLIRKFMRRDIKYLEALNNGKKTKRELAKVTNVSYRAANLIIRKYLKLNFVSSKQIKVYKNKRFYNSLMFELTERGKELTKYLIGGIKND